MGRRMRALSARRGAAGACLALCGFALLYVLGPLCAPPDIPHQQDIMVTHQVSRKFHQNPKKIRPLSHNLYKWPSIRSLTENLI